MCFIVDGLLGMFQWLWTGLPRAFWTMSLVHWGICLRIELLHHRVCITLSLLNDAKLFSQSGFCQFILPLAVYEISLPELVRLLNSLPIRWEYGIFVVLNHSFFITNEAEHLFMFIGNVNSLFGEVAVQIFHLILNFKLPFSYWFVGVIFWSIYSGRGPVLSIWVENIFHFVACLFTLFRVAFHDQKFLNVFEIYQTFPFMFAWSIWNEVSDCTKKKFI